MIKNLFILGSILVGSSAFAQTTIFQENFDTAATRNLWTIGDRDGDNDTWEYLNAELNEVPSFQGDAAFSFSWYWEAFTPDNTLTSPVITLPANQELSLSFKVAAGDDELFEEHYAVYVIPANTEFTGNEEPVFEETLDAGYYYDAKTVTVDISEYAGQDVQLVFRHYDCEDVFYLGLDDVMIEQASLQTADVSKVKVVVFQENDWVSIKGFNEVNQVKVFDLIGKNVMNVQADKVNLSTLPKGIYIVNFYNEHEVQSKKIIRK